MMRSIRFQTLGSVLTVAALALSAHPAADAQGGRFGERADVVLVEIPVHVSRDGEPVRGLTAENFVVLEGRKKQEIVAVDAYDLAALSTANAASAAAAVAPPPAARRYFVLLFDLSNSFPAGIVRAREAALEMARTKLYPSDLVAVATYSQRKGIEILLSFTGDRAQLVAALDDLGLVDPYERFQDPLRLRVAASDEEIAEYQPQNPNGFSQREGIMTILLENLKDLSTLNAHANRDQVKQQILELSSNLDSLAKLLDSVTGRKQIVLFSQGFDSDIVFGTRDAERIQENVNSVQEGQLWRVDSEERFGYSDVQNSLLAMLEDFNRSDAVIHSVDVGGLAAGGDAAAQQVGYRTFDTATLDRGHDGLFLMADQTGGEFYRNFNDLGVAMEDLLERTSVTYVVSFRPKDVVMDGSYHPIKIELVGVGKGVKLSHRPGYYARRAFAELDPTERQLANAEKLVAGTSGGEIGTRVLAAAFPTGSPSADVLTAIEIDGSSLIGRQQDNMVPAEIYAYAFDREGQIRDFFTQAISIDLYKLGYRLSSGLKLLGHLELLPGDYEIRTLVRNVLTGDAGLAVTRLEVPDYGGFEPALLPPFFIEKDDQWLVAMAEQEGEEIHYPLMGGGRPLVPAARPRLASEQRIPMLLVGYELPRTLEAEAQLIGPDGKIRDGGAIEIDRRVGDTGSGERVIAYLRTPRVDPGDYRLVVTVRGDGQEVTSSVPVTFLALE